MLTARLGWITAVVAASTEHHDPLIRSRSACVIRSAASLTRPVLSNFQRRRDGTSCARASLDGSRPLTALTPVAKCVHGQPEQTSHLGRGQVVLAQWHPRADALNDLLTVAIRCRA